MYANSMYQLNTNEQKLKAVFAVGSFLSILSFTLFAMSVRNECEEMGVLLCLPIFGVLFGVLSILTVFLSFKVIPRCNEFIKILFYSVVGCFNMSIIIYQILELFINQKSLTTQYVMFVIVVLLTYYLGPLLVSIASFLIILSRKTFYVLLIPILFAVLFSITVYPKLAKKHADANNYYVTPNTQAPPPGKILTN